MRVVLGFIPEPWRTRYGDEIADALAVSESKLKDGVDVIVWGLTLRIERRPYRSAAAAALAAAFILVYGILALGLVGDEGDPSDRIYAGVLGVGIIGALIARFRPRGMARAMFATAFAQATVAQIALAAGKHRSPVTSIPELLGLNGMFVLLFVGSARLFRLAARERPPAEPATDGRKGWLLHSF